tara:strand:+ start:59 stop:373 length:315 start_codon:yes stop_codon:yes gene_type:complete
MIDKLFVLLNDITDRDNGDIIEKIGIDDKKSYKNRPKECPNCNRKTIAGLEVIGAYDSSLIWQCMKCGDRFLKLSRIKTLNLLEDATSAWTNPNDWGEIDKQLN